METGSSIHLTYDCKLVLYLQLIQNGSLLMLLPLSLCWDLHYMRTQAMGELPHTNQFSERKHTKKRLCLMSHFMCHMSCHLPTVTWKTLYSASAALKVPGGLVMRLREVWWLIDKKSKINKMTKTQFVVATVGTTNNQTHKHTLQTID